MPNQKTKKEKTTDDKPLNERSVLTDKNEEEKPAKRTARRTTAKKTAEPKEKTAENAPAEPKKTSAAKRPSRKAAAKKAPAAEPVPVAAEQAPELPQPRRSVAFIGSECYPFVKTGGLGDVMYALPKALSRLNCDVKVILPKYRCIPQQFHEKMVWRGTFRMDLCSDGRAFHVGIMEYVWDGVVYDFIENDEFFSTGNPYTNLIDDIPRFCYFSKAALAALN